MKLDRKVAEAFNAWMERDKLKHVYEFIWETDSMKMVKGYMLPNSKKKAGFDKKQLAHVQAAMKNAISEISKKQGKPPADVKGPELEKSQTLAAALDDVMQDSGKALQKRFDIFKKSKEYRIAMG
ncbi:MAG: hypothetical protein AB8B85_19285 [Paracoccaceae bacterium]